MENDIQKIRREAARDVLRALVPALGIGDIVINDCKMIVKMNEKMYVVNDRGNMGVKSLAEIVKDLVIYGYCPRVSYVKEMKK